MTNPTTTTTTTTTTTSPARPILASTLLSRERKKWDPGIRHHWQTGLPNLDQHLPPSLWTGGKVIGIVDESNNGLNIDTALGSSRIPIHLITNLITTHLTRLHNATFRNHESAPSSSTAPLPAAIYIISPVTPISISTSTSSSPSTSPISPSSLAASLESASLPLSLLDTISLLQYFDFPGLADAVAEVSQVLFTTTTITTTTTNDNNNKNDKNDKNDNAQPQSTTEQQSQSPSQSILVLAGLSSTLASISQRSGTVATNALLAPLLRSLTLLSRSHADVLVLLLLEPEALDSPSLDNVALGEEMSAFSSPTHTTPTARSERGEEKGGKRGGGRGGFSGPRSLAATTNLLVQGMDTLVLVHDHTPAHAGMSIAAGGEEQGIRDQRRTSGIDREGGEAVVEVLFVRVGEAGGCWAVR